MKRLTPSIPIRDIEREIAHIRGNARRLRKFVGMEHEARCRKLCALYLSDFIYAWKLKQVIQRLK